VTALKFMQDLIFRHRLVKINPRTELDSPESDSAINDGKVASVGAPEWFVGCFGTQIADLMKRLAHSGFRPGHAAEVHSLPIPGTTNPERIRPRHPLFQHLTN
jgi:hypothetical protein